MSLFADVILPLPLNATYTYRIPDTMQLCVGARVIVPLRGRKYYTALVDRIHGEEPQGFEVKDIAEQLDTSPVLLPEQLRLWHWMADYYLCALGDILKAALPSGMKIESETVVVRTADELPDSFRQERYLRLWSALQQQPEQSLLSLEKKSGVHPVLSAVRRLLDAGIVTLKEEVRSTYRPRLETFVCLQEAYQNEQKLLAVMDGMKRAEKQLQLLHAFLDYSGWASAFQDGNTARVRMVPRAALLHFSGVQAAVLQALVKRGILDFETHEVGRLQSSEKEEMLHPAAVLSVEQQNAFEAICGAFREKPVCLLHGVTSSGKTEVYIHLIQTYLQQKKQVLFLLPEIVLTAQLTERLRRVFGSRLGVYHSKFSDAERVEIWKKQLSSEPYDVIVGVRSSVFLPFRNLGLVIVDEEHEASYKQQDPAPRYHARNVALVLASYFGAQTLLGTATPSFESYYHARCGKYALVNLHTRYAEVALPEVKVVDTKELGRKRLMKGPFSPQLLDAVHEALQAREQVILFQNRRGFAPVVQCKECDWIPKCKNCDVSLTYHKRLGVLTCHYCGYTCPVPVQCPSCGNRELVHKGFGTEKIEDEIQTLFPGARVARMDLDTTRSRRAYEHILYAFETGETDILIGTQMISKGLDFDRVRVVGILDADSMLNIPDFRSYERAFQMMAQVAGRAGRRGKQGLVLLQTRNSELPVIHQVMAHDYLSHYLMQMQERRIFHYPPFCHLIYVYMKHRYEHVLDRLAQDLAMRMRQLLGDRVLGPDAPPVSRIQLLYIRKIVIKVEASASLVKVRHALQALCRQVLSEDAYATAQLYFDVDPL